MPETSSQIFTAADHEAQLEAIDILHALVAQGELAMNAVAQGQLELDEIMMNNPVLNHMYERQMGVAFLDDEEEEAAFADDTDDEFPPFTPNAGTTTAIVFPDVYDEAEPPFAPNAYTRDFVFTFPDMDGRAAHEEVFLF